MIYLRSIKNSVYLKAAALALFALFITAAQAQDNATLVIKGETSMKLRAKGTGINVGVKSVDWKEEAVEGVIIEVKKNGVTISKTTSGKKGKYSIEIPVNTTDAKNDYVIYYSKDGMAPKTVNVNAFLPKEEFAKYPPAPKYEVSLDVPLITTTVKDIVPDKPFAKIKWDKLKEHKFTVDPTYAKTSQSEELKILANPDQYYTLLAKKKAKADEALAKKNAAAEAKLKAAEDAKKKAEEEARLKEEAEAKRLADIKAREEAEKLARLQAEAMKNEQRRKQIADSLAMVAKNNAANNANASLDIKKTVRTTSEDLFAGKDMYDVAETFSINVARRSLNAEKENRNKEKSRNLSAKYETINTLTSLLNEVDDYDKKSKRQ